MLKTIIAATALSVGYLPATQAQLPSGVFAGEPDYKLAPAGPYDLDPAHTAIIARVSHIGYSFSVFRFEKVTGTLRWDPARPTRSALTATVQTGSIATPVAGFAAELAGERFLKSATFPAATFVSDHVVLTDPQHGRVGGVFTLMGKAVPLTFGVTFIGAGKGFMGHPRLGVEAVATIHPADFGLSGMPAPSIALVIDAEFAQGG